MNQLTDIKGHWRCVKCSRVEPVEHVYCGNCATERFPINTKFSIPEHSSSVKESLTDFYISTQNKCSIVAFMRGCLNIGINIGVVGYSDMDVQMFIRSLYEKGFFQFSNTFNLLKRGDIVGDEILSQLATWYDVCILYEPEREISRYMGNTSSTKVFNVKWTYSGGLGHYYFSPN